MRKGDHSGWQAMGVTASQKQAGDVPGSLKLAPKDAHYHLKGSEAVMPGCRHKADGEVHTISAVSVPPSPPRHIFFPSVPGHVSVLAASHSGWKVGTE